MDDRDGGQRPVTQEQVARRAGVSRSVVSYVLNGGPRPVSAEARARVLDAIQELDYRPNKHAQLLIREKWDSVAARQIGVVMAHGTMFERPYYGSILAGLHEGAQALNGHIRFIHLFASLKNPALLNQRVHRHEVSGLVLLALDQVLHDESDLELLERITSRVRNVVCVEWQREGLASVTFDRHKAAFDVTAHVLSLGHRTVGYIGPRDERVGGFHAALAAVGAEARFTLDADDAHSGLQQARIHLANEPRPTALVAGTDEVAFGLLKELRDRALRVPGDVALVSIDNIDLSEFASPSLTTVDVPKQELGRQAVRMLVDRLQADAAAIPRSVMLPTTLIVRESSGVHVG